MPRFLGINYFKEASKSYQKCISEYSLSEPWHLEQHKDVVYIHKPKSTKELFIQPWRKVQIDEAFLLKESNDIHTFGDLVNGFDPFQFATYQRLSGIVPSSIEEETANSRCSQTHLNGSPAVLVGKSSEIQPYDINKLKTILETGHEWLFDEPILNDYLHELQSTELRKKINMEKSDISVNTTKDEYQMGNDIFLFKKYHPKNPLNDCLSTLDAEDVTNVPSEEYQRCLLPELMDEEYDEVLKQLCLAILDPQKKSREKQTLVGQSHHETSQNEKQYDNTLKTEAANDYEDKHEPNTSGSTNADRSQYDGKLEDQSVIYTMNEPYRCPKNPSVDERDKNDIKIMKKDELAMNSHHRDNLNFEIKDVEELCSRVETKNPTSANKILNANGKCEQSVLTQNLLVSPEVLEVIGESHLTPELVKENLNPFYSSDSTSRKAQEHELNSVDILQSEFMDDDSFLDSSMFTFPLPKEASNGTATAPTNADKTEFLDRFSKPELNGSLQSALKIKSDKVQFGKTEQIDEALGSPPKKKAHTIDFRRNRCKIKAIDTKSIISMHREVSDLTKVNSSNLLDSFVFLRTGVVPKKKKGWMQELDAKCKNSPVEVLMETGKDSTSNLPRVNLEPLTIKNEKIKKESPSQFLPITIICSSTVLDMSELVQLLEIKYNVNFIERNYKRNFNCDNNSTSWTFFYADLIIDEKTALVFCKMEDLQDYEQFLKFRQRIYHLMLKFTKCWVLVFQPNNSAITLHYSVIWKHFTKLSVWASQLSNNTQYEIQVKVICSTSEYRSLAVIIRHIFDYTISNNSLWTKEQWANRSWILPEMSLHEKFLLTFPSLNSFNAQAVLGAISITQLLTAELQDLQKTLPWIPPNILKMLYAIIHWKSPIHAQLSKPSQTFIKTDEINPNLSNGTSNCPLTQNEDKFQLNYIPSKFMYDEEMDDQRVSNPISLPMMPIQDCNYRAKLLNEQLTMGCGFYTGALFHGCSSVPLPSLGRAAFVSHAGEWFHGCNTFQEINSDQSVAHLFGIPESPKVHFLPSNRHPSSFLKSVNNYIWPACDKPNMQLAGAQSSWQWGDFRSEEELCGSGSTVKKPTEIPKLRYQKVAGNKGQTRLTFK